jgi:hypothetical protein
MTVGTSIMVTDKTGKRSVNVLEGGILDGGAFFPGVFIELAAPSNYIGSLDIGSCRAK